MANSEILTIDHLGDILDNLREKDLMDIADLDIALDHLTSGKSIAWALTDKRVIAIGGIREIWPRCGEAWTLCSPQVYKHPRSFQRIAKAAIAKAERDGFHRIQCTVDANDDAALKWIESLGFVIEGLLSKYTSDGRHHYQYARVI